LKEVNRKDELAKVSYLLAKQCDRANQLGAAVSERKEATEHAYQARETFRKSWEKKNVRNTSYLGNTSGLTSPASINRMSLFSIIKSQSNVFIKI
jgi:hypothetical protein